MLGGGGGGLLAAGLNPIKCAVVKTNLCEKGGRQRENGLVDSLRRGGGGGGQSLCSACGQCGGEGSRYRLAARLDGRGGRAHIPGLT